MNTIQTLPTMRKSIIIWLLTGCLLIAAMVVIGGITRLTGSGLSITEWKLIRGAIPPLNDQQWQEEFENYKAIPQYQKLNYHFTLDDFKQIYFWEYFHRLIGRVIGMVFLIPFLFFWMKKQFDRKLMRNVLLLFALGAFQGFLGWFMVKSGLTKNTYVSHYRLAIHLISAFITFGFTFKVALDLIYPENKPYDLHLKKLYRLAWITLGVVTLQIIYGAFVAGLHAGHIFNNFPKMDDDWISSSVSFALQKNGITALFDAIPVVQFIHRYVAYVAVFLILYLFFMARNFNRARMNNLFSAELKNAVNLLPVIVLLQFTLGVFTLLFSVPVWLGVLHQIVAFILFALMVFLIHRLQSGKMPATN